MSRMPLREYPTSALTVSAIRSSYQPSNSNKSAGSGRQQSLFRGSSMINGNDASGGDEYDSRIPGVAEPSGVYDVLMTDSDMALTKRKFVKVSSVGEIEVTPDRIEFCIQIFSTKPDLTAAKESIRKRDDFLVLALKKLGIPPDGVTTTSMVKKYKLEDEVEADDDLMEMKILRDIEKQMATDKKAKKGKQDDKNKDRGGEVQETILNMEKVKVVKELYVVCDSLNQYMELFSIVNEKLDRQVTVSPPVIRITPENLQNHSQAAAKLAMSNAVEKANQLLHSQKNLKATVGKLFYSVEDSLTITDIAEYHNISTSTAFESLNWKRNNKLITCKLTCLFEVNTVKSNRRAI